MAKSSNRDRWRLVGGKWTRSIGHRGARVRLFQNRRGGAFHRAVWVPGHGRDVACLHTRDRDEALRLGRQFLAAFLANGRGWSPDRKITLKELWERFRREAPAFLDNHPTTKGDAEARAQVLMGYFGEDCDVRSLTANDQAAYSTQRLAGGIGTPGGRVTRQVRPRSAEADLVVLHQILSWATTVRVAGGGRWLDRNPLEGVRRIREPNPRRPVATWERFVKTRTALQRLAAEAGSDGERARWLKLELALVLAEATGRRLGAIRQLRWEDVDFQRGKVLWRAEADKKRREWVIPVPARLLKELRRFQKSLGAVGGWIFSAEHDSDRPMDRYLFDKWLAVAEKKAELPKLEGGLWHPYRRKWATERKGHPLNDVAAAGGWKDTRTILQRYQQPDEETILAVMSEGRKLREVSPGS